MPVIYEFSVPSAGDLATCVIHWPPTKDEGNLEVFRATRDRRYLSIRVLSDLFGAQLDNIRMIDIYTRRRPIKAPDQTRLQGSRPYDFDPSLLNHHAHCKMQIEIAPGPLILCGKHVEKFFEPNFGTFVNGEEMEIAGRVRRVYYIDLPEYLAQWASAERLKRLTSTLTLLKKYHGITISKEWIPKTSRLGHDDQDQDESGDYQSSRRAVSAAASKIKLSARPNRWNAEAHAHRAVKFCETIIRF